MAKVELQKVNTSHDCPLRPRVTDFDKNEKDEGDEKEKRSEEREDKTSTGRSPNGRERGIHCVVVRRKGGGRRVRCRRPLWRYFA